MSRTTSQPASAPPARSESILQARGLRRTFRMGDSLVTVLRDVDLTLREGEFVAIEGRSGSGKSTLLHILGALDGVDEGTVEFRGEHYARRIDQALPGLVGLMTRALPFWIAFVLEWLGGIAYVVAPAFG